MRLVFEQLRPGGDRNFGYLLGDRDTGEAVVIDPSYSPELFVERAQAQRLRITHIVNTHGHPDHVNGNERAVALTGAPIAAHPLLKPDIVLDDDGELRAAGLAFRILHVPGHCENHIVLFEPQWRLAFTGDILFVGKVGGTRSDEDARVEWDSLQKILRTVPDEAAVWPGHDYGALPSSTMAIERHNNPFLRCSNVDEFIALKRNWTEYKKQHGLR